MILVLDAMGVIYTTGDDVGDLLVPFIRENGNNHDETYISERYQLASLGQITAPQFWLDVGLDPALEDSYLNGHSLQENLYKFLETATTRFEKIVCLSNDVSEWSLKLRKKFNLEEYISDWFISGDIGSRKPDTKIYQYMAKILNVDFSQLVLIDDRSKNILAALSLGMHAFLFCENSTDIANDELTAICDFHELFVYMKG